MPAGFHSTSILVSYLINFISSFITSHPSFQRHPSDGTLQEAERGDQAGGKPMQRIHKYPKRGVMEKFNTLRASRVVTEWAHCWRSGLSQARVRVSQPLPERWPLYTLLISRVAGEMLTHLAGIVKQVRAPRADRIWPGGIRLRVGCPGLCDLYFGDCAAWGNKSSSLGENLLKWVRARFNSFGTSEFWVLLFKRANDILLPISSPPSPPRMSPLLITLRNHLAFI